MNTLLQSPLTLAGVRYRPVVSETINALSPDGVVRMIGVPISAARVKCTLLLLKAIKAAGYAYLGEKLDEKSIQIPNHRDSGLKTFRPQKSVMDSEPFQLDEATELSVRQLLQQLDSTRPPFILDVRQPEELLESPAIPSAVNIPMGQLMQRLHELPKSGLEDADAEARQSQTPKRHTGSIVIVCHSGNRSLVAQHFLSTKGYDCKSLAGGMVAWNSATGKKD